MFPLADQKIEFASFLEAMHDHSQVENPEKELLNAFKSHDRERRGYVNASEVQHIMLSMGERLSRQEGKEKKNIGKRIIFFIFPFKIKALKLEKALRVCLIHLDVIFHLGLPNRRISHTCL